MRSSQRHSIGLGIAEVTLRDLLTGPLLIPMALAGLPGTNLTLSVSMPASSAAIASVEVSFLTDPTEEERLGKDDYKQKLADTICVAISEYVEK